MLDEYITKLLHKIAKSEGFVDYKFDTKSGSNHGDNFMGVMTAVTITGNNGQNGHSKPENLHLICKAPPMNEMRRIKFKSDLIFDREVYMYKKVLPAFVRFQNEKGLSENDSFLSFPKTFVCTSENGAHILIMEDLRPKNYVMLPKETIAPLDHQLKILEELGKFHAISFAMKDQRPDEFAEFTKMKDNFSEMCLHGHANSYMKEIIGKVTTVLKNPAHKKMMENFQATYVETIYEYLNGASSQDFGVIGHGDCWNNNFLFQYDDDNNNKELKSVCILDFQLARYAPPVLDLLYYIFSSTDKQMRKDHYETLLKTYYSSLSETIEKLGSDPKKLYTFKNLESQMRKFGQFALLCAPMIIQIRVASAKNIANLDDFAEMTEKDVKPDFIKFDEDSDKMYSTWIDGVVTDLVNYGYVDCQ